MLRTLLAIRQKSRKPSFWEMMDSFVLLAYASSAASRTLFQQLPAWLNFTLDYEDLFCLIQTKKVISMNYGNGTGSWWPWRRVILTMRDICVSSNLNPVIKFTSSSRSTKFKDIFLWNISQMILKTIPISTRIVISYAMKRDIPFWVSQKVNGNWDNNMIRISQWRESHCRTNTSVRRNK